MLFSYGAPRISEIAGFDAEDLAGKLREEMPGITIDQHLWRQHIRDLKAHRPFRNLIYSLRGPDGDLRIFSSSGKPCFDQQNNFLGYRGVASDITSERDAEAKRHEAEIRLANAIELIPAALSLYDSQDRLVLCNGADRAIFETTAISERGASFSELLNAVVEADVLQGSDRDVEEWRARRLERRSNPCRGFSYQLRDGRWLEVNDYILMDGDLMSVCVDITERKNAEQSLRAHEAELAQVLRRSTLDQMSAIMAHELNQPLTAVVNFSNGCLRRLKAGDREIEKYIPVLEEMRDQAKRASAILKRVGGFVGQALPEEAELEVPDLIHSVKLLLNAELARNHAKLDLVLPAGLPRVLGERVELEQVLFNLIKNAIEATLDRPPGERWVKVTLDQSEDDTIVITVKDSGLGFSLEMESSAFEPFKTSKPDGMGMGLSICRTIVEAHGGSIRIEAGSSDGGLVCVTLPSIKEYAENVA